MTKDQAKDELIHLLYRQMIDLSLMSKIELGDDVCAEIRRLTAIIDDRDTEDYPYLSDWDVTLMDGLDDLDS